MDEDFILFEQYSGRIAVFEIHEHLHSLPFATTLCPA